MTTDDKRSSRPGRLLLAWLSATMLAMLVAPATAAVAWSMAVALGPAAEAMEWPGFESAAFDLGLLLPALLTGLGIPIAYLALPRLSQRLLGAVPTAPIAAHQHLRRAADRAARRQGVTVRLRLHPGGWVGPVAMGNGDDILLMLPADLAVLDDDRLDAIITPVVNAARRRPAESRFRLAALGPVLAVHAFWRSMRWNRGHRVPLFLLLAVGAYAFAPAPVESAERILVAPVLAVTAVAALAALWTFRAAAVTGLRWITDRALGDPASSVTSPSWALELADERARAAA